MIREFKEFAIKGNMFDMAIGIVIGTAFHKIISSLVDDIIMPPLGYIIGRVDFSDLSIVIQKKVVEKGGDVVKELVAFNYGNFIQVMIDFLVITVTIFLVIKLFNKLRRKAEDEKEKEIPTPREIELLAEIRDLLKAKPE
ncbi:MAG: large-conductance mechanosensitive channel protein MscL [Bacteroidales bacterium]|nr:large-conductance mechanosensitive channel protein MscL [Bacteroidales bacterium]